MVSLFERLDKGRPPPPTEKGHRDVTPTEKLLDWIMNYWTEDTLTARDICCYGPNPTRDRERAINSAEILVKRGWLAPIKAHRRDSREWQIVRKPAPKTADVSEKLTGQTT
jgi:hypothetical protein